MSYNHGDHDFAVNWAAQRGIGVTFFLGYSAGCNPATAAGRQCYADRSAALAQKYGNKVQYYEVWNEWNGGLGLGGYPACQPNCTDKAMYTDLLCRTYRAIKAVRPTATVAGGVTAGVDMNFLTGMFNAGAKNCMDAVAVHPYPYNPSTGVYHVPYTSGGAAGVNKFVESINAVNNLVIQRTGKPMPILVTETGRSDGGQVAQRQLTTDFLTALYAKALTGTIPSLGGIWWFGLEDYSKQQWGLLQSNNVKKSSFQAFQSAANR